MGGQVIRCSLEHKRACNGCGSRTDVLTLGLGAEHIRVCDTCFGNLVRAQFRLKVEKLDAIEVGK